MLATLVFGRRRAAVWYSKPDLLEEVAKSSPNAPPVKKAAPVKVDAGQLNRVQAELDKAQNALKASQEEKTKVMAKSKPTWKAKLKETTKLKDLAEKAEMAKAEAEQKVAKILQDQGNNKSGLEGINKLLQRAPDPGNRRQGVAKLAAAKKEVEKKLEDINKMLADEKIQGEGPQGLAEVIAARNKLVMERDELDQAIKGAYQELAKGGLVAPSDDPRGKIVDAAKIAGRAISSRHSAPAWPSR